MSTRKQAILWITFVIAVVLFFPPLLAIGIIGLALLARLVSYLRGGRAQRLPAAPYPPSHGHPAPYGAVYPPQYPPHGAEPHAPSYPPQYPQHPYPPMTGGQR